MTKKMRQGGVASCLVVGNYCHDVLIKDGDVLAESLGGATSFISGVLDGLSVTATFILKCSKKFCCVVVTNGKNGCTLYYRDDEQQIAPFQTIQIDPTSAGDSFLGGLVAGLAQGLAVPDAALLGIFFGSLTVGLMGLPKFDSDYCRWLREKCCNCWTAMNRKNTVSIFKPLDQEDFLTSLSTTKSLLTRPTQKCQVGLPSLPEVVEQYNHLPTGQSKQFLGFIFYEPIWSGDGMP